MTAPTLLFRSDQSFSGSEPDELALAVHPQLVHYVGSMPTDRVLADGQEFGDLSTGVAFADQPEPLLFSARQRGVVIHISLVCDRSR